MHFNISLNITKYAIKTTKYTKPEKHRIMYDGELLQHIQLKTHLI